MTTTQRPALAFSLRLSRAADESSSFDVQLRACRAQATALGLDPDSAVIYEDYGVSGASALESRKGGMARILADRPHVVIAAKLDRFARSVGEFLKLVAWARENDVTLATADGELNTGTTNGKLIATILVALAEWERDTMTDRIKDAHAERREQGRWISGKAPWPYVMERRDGKAYLAEDPDAFEACRKAIAALLAGGTLAATAEPLPIGRHQWRKLLRGVMLRGWRGHAGKLLCDSDGVTPTQFGPEVVDAATHKRVQERLVELAAGERAERRDAPWLAGLVRCHCGTAYNGGMSSRKRPLYKCAAGCGSIMAHVIEPAVEDAFIDVHGSELLYTVSYAGGIDHSAEMADLDAKIKRGTANMLLMDPEDAAELRALVAELCSTRARLAAEHAPEVTETRTLTNTMLFEAWEGSDLDQRASLLHSYGLRVMVMPRGSAGGRLRIEWEVPA
ncbi:recombinase family protein [Streptomyces sp. NPDC001978]|uniref:recombinase family protein n=1 Tax=Streptomyces sp. NPDC001978 TaxID=3364627 RepID=UPI0036A6F8B0